MSLDSEFEDEADEIMDGDLRECGICGGAHPVDFDGDCRDNANRYPKSGEITAHDGLLWRGDQMLDIIEADRVARERGFPYAEQLVKALEKPKYHGK